MTISYFGWTFIQCLWRPKLFFCTYFWSLEHFVKYANKPGSPDGFSALLIILSPWVSCSLYPWVEYIPWISFYKYSLWYIVTCCWSWGMHMKRQRLVNVKDNALQTRLNFIIYYRFLMKIHVYMYVSDEK